MTEFIYLHGFASGPNSSKAQAFKKRFEKENGDLLFYALSVRDYENIALNMADIKRYIEQQKQIIIYYEKAVTPQKKEPEKDKK